MYARPAGSLRQRTRIRFSAGLQPPLSWRSPCYPARSSMGYPHPVRLRSAEGRQPAGGGGPDSDAYPNKPDPVTNASADPVTNASADPVTNGYT